MEKKIVLNGIETLVDNGATVLDIVQSRSVEPAHVVVEVNGAIVERSQFNSVSPGHGDKVEILRFVGGG